MDKPGIHDIRLRFKCKGLWSILPLYSDSDNLIENMDLKSNRDIILKDIDLKEFVIKPTIHKTDTVSVAIACSESPIPINLEGLAKATSGITRVEERLQRVVDEYIKQNIRSRKLSSSVLITKTPIPNHMTWIVTMWHFGQDSLTEYTGERFEMSWEDGLKLFRIYSKDYRNKKKMRVRKEIQECPNKPLKEAFMDKISEEDGDHEEA
jgi:hypothetical protein